jgi:hypothetical protein
MISVLKALGTLIGALKRAPKESGKKYSNFKIDLFISIF